MVKSSFATFFAQKGEVKEIVCNLCAVYIV